MKHAYPILVVLAAAWMTACTSQPAKTDTSAEVPPAKAAAAKDAARKAAARKEAAKAETVVRKEEAVEGEVVGKPASGSKFARLKTGLTLSQVEQLIGPPTKQWQHPTDKASIPFYFGPDRWVIQYSYRHEGVLTFNSGGEQLLTRIEVNKAE
ncbi:hypothetical protein MIZ01_0276 [Sideroxyarcus emersonii]|uniref:Outer membrane protein assembly factor BamE n=1 Tax=Sideroxyarcus emersonii TaxID=2764705 RepID=A0AAN2BXV3_9PROT|nr:hypothetical protein [Sideroxyarcus emersonii]BCK86514.1 hypothetical protein MIZ01_0276 [Sideroxyarcus emersonii]